MNEEWLMPGAVVPVDVETTSALLAEIRRLIGVVGGMALNRRREWVGLTQSEIAEILCDDRWQGRPEYMLLQMQAKLKEKNNAN